MDRRKCSKIEKNLRKNNSKRAYQLAKSLTTVKQGKATTVQDRSGNASQKNEKCWTNGQNTALSCTNTRPMEVSTKPPQPMAWRLAPRRPSWWQTTHRDQSKWTEAWDYHRLQVPGLSYNWWGFQARDTVGHTRTQNSQPYPLVNGSINGTNLSAVEHFTYMGSIISNDASQQGSWQLPVQSQQFLCVTNFSHS